MASFGSRHREPEPEKLTIPRPKDIWSFTSLMADILRLPDETLAMAYMYYNHWTKFTRSGEPYPALDPHNQTLALASLSAACKGAESPRRPREILLPAYRIINSSNSSSKPLIYPSELYDRLRKTLLAAEHRLLLVVKFELRTQLPLEYVERYLDRTVGELNLGRGRWTGAENYDGYGRTIKRERKVLEFMETGIGKECTARAVEACKDYQLSNFFPARAVAAACVSLTLKSRGLEIGCDTEAWLDDATSGKVNLEDFQEASTILESNESTAGR